MFNSGDKIRGEKHGKAHAKSRNKKIYIYKMAKLQYQR